MSSGQSSLSHYERGATTLFASQDDPRFSYCLYVPQRYREEGEDRLPLVVVVHGTTRTAQQYRNAFADFAERRGCLILAPLFPAGLTRPYELDSYKFIQQDGIRFDRVLLDIIDQVAGRYRVDVSQFLMHGFSGGGQFAHRFFYLHPHRLAGISIGAPGLVTLIDPERPWWVGIKDLDQRFGVDLDLLALARVPVHMVIGARDTETWDINDKDSPNWMEGAYDLGKTRIQRLEGLRDNYLGHGIRVRYDVVPDVAHQGFDVLAPVRRFFSRVLDMSEDEVA